METKFNFKSAICTSREQSERLLALGLKKETADMALHFSCVDMDGNAYYIPYTIGHRCTGIPAWSLDRLKELYKCVGDTSLWNLDDVNYDRLIQCIDLAIKRNCFNKEYLV